MEKLIDLLEKNTCLWDVSKREYLSKNKRKKALSDMSDELDIEVADIKTFSCSEEMNIHRIPAQP